jgi:hypothetical protein
MFNRTLREAPLDGGDNPPKKVTVTYTSDNCPEKGQLSASVRLNLLRTVVETPGLLDCGLELFQSLTMRHNGVAWVLTLEAVNLR